MGHIERESTDALSSKAFIRVGNPKQKMAKEKFVVKKPPSRPFPLKLVLFSIIRERELERRETQRGIRARGHTHTHTHTERERRCVIARFVRVTREREREREIDAFFFLLCDERTYPNEREEGGIEKDDVAASFRVVFDDFDFGWFVHK